MDKENMNLLHTFIYKTWDVKICVKHTELEDENRPQYGIER